MAGRAFLGEFEQMVLLAILRQANETYAPQISRELERCTERSVSRSALYTTLDRLRKKGLLDWRLQPGDDVRSGLPKRCFTVTPAGITALRATRKALLNLWQGVEDTLGESAL